jgi:protoporphyrinogen oxidase
VPESHPGPPVVVIGAGPAGLTAAYELGKAGHPAVVLEASDVVGGISRTVERDGWRFDIGGHRFFTKVPEVEALWHEILPDEEFLLRPRMSRIYYRGKLFDYPLKAGNALRSLGLLEAVRCVLSYALVRVRPPKDQSNFEGWVAARFGWRLYRIFFKTYTEKVWGVDATEIQADWAAQRIKNLSLLSAVTNALLPKRNQKEIASLIEEFQYPKLGPGLMWERCAEHVESSAAGALRRPRHPHRARRRGATGSEASTARRAAALEVADVVSSMPISALVRLRPAAPPEVLAAADDLRYRDFLTVALVVPERFSFPDNWIYIHSPEVRSAACKNFGSWSPFLVKDGGTCLGPRVLRRTRATAPGTCSDDELDLARDPRDQPSSAWSPATSSRPGTSCGRRRPTRCTTSTTSATSRSSGPGWPRPCRTCTRWAATACTATTTPTTACSPRCSRSRTCSPASRSTTSGRSTSRRTTTRSSAPRCPRRPPPRPPPAAPGATPR